MTTSTDTADDDLHRELAESLGADVPDGPWVVERVLKESPSEVTQLVWLRTASGGELGPFVRKLISPGSGLGSMWLRLCRYQQEGLRSRHLPHVIGCSETPDGRLSVVMERVVGPTLRERVLETPPYERRALADRIIPNLCSAATELNESLGETVVHRDITPSNVICSGLEGDVPVLIDLGIARTWDKGRETDTTHFGTRAYAPPEQFGFGQTDLRTDVYAIGMCAFFCLTGRDPTPQDRRDNFASTEVPTPWREVIARACSYDPSERYASAREMGTELSRLLRTDEQGARPPAPHHGATAGEVLLKVWRARNVVVVPVMAILVAASTYGVFDPATLYRGSPWFNAYGYLVWLNYCILALGYACMDKRWLKRHVRVVREWSAGRMALVLVGIFAGLTTMLVIVAGTIGTS